MSRTLSLVAVASFVLAALVVAPEASAMHNCPVEYYESLGANNTWLLWTLETSDRLCDGYHGHSCHGPYVNYGWFGTCL